MSAPAAPTWAAFLQPYSPSDLTPIPGSPPPSERTRARLLDSPHMGDAAWADVLLDAGLEWGPTDNADKGDS